MSSKEKDTEVSSADESEEMKELEEIEKKVNDTKPKDEQEKNDKKSEGKNIETKKENKKIEKEEKNIDNQESEDKVKNEKKSKNKALWITITIATIVLIVLIFSTIFALINLGKNTIAKGVSIKGIDVSNLTIEEATNKINEAINVELLLGIDLVYGEDYKVDFTPNQIQYEYDISSAVKEAYNIGKSENIIINDYSLLKTAFFGKNIEPQSTYNEDSLQGIVDDIGSKIPGLVVQASYYIEGDQLIINKGTSGIEVKKDELKSDILDNIENRNAFEMINKDSEDVIQIQVNNAQPDPIDLQKIYDEIYTEPKDAYYIPEPFQIFKEENGIDFAITMEEAQNIISDENATEYTIPLKITPAEKTIDDIGTEAFPYLISSYTTKYDASNTNRSGNLKIASDKINGTVLMPGEEFSFNEVVGKRTIEDGYKDAKIYENGKVVDGLAGGICQISSTLYNAVLLANLNVTERRNHSYTSTYVPAGRDATVVYGKQDFKFINTREYPVKLESSVANGIVTFNIHGIKQETEYDIKIIPVTTQTIPFETEYVPDPTLAPGQQVVTQAGHSGYKVTTYIEKRLGGVVVSKDVLSNDIYNAMKTVINVGP